MTILSLNDKKLPKNICQLIFKLVVSFLSDRVKKIEKEN